MNQKKIKIARSVALATIFFVAILVSNLRAQKIFKVLCFSGEAVVSFKTKDLSFLKYDKKEFFLVKEKKGKDTVLSVIYGDSISNKINSNQALISKSVITDFKIIKI